MALTAAVLVAALAAYDAMAVPFDDAATTSMQGTPAAPALASSAVSAAPSTMVPSAITLATTAPQGLATPDVPNPVSATTSPATPVSPSSSLAAPTSTVFETVFLPASTVTITGAVPTITQILTIAPPPSVSATLQETAWAAPPQMTDLAAFNIKNFAYGQENMHIIVSEPPAPNPAPNAPGGPSGAASANTNTNASLAAALALTPAELAAELAVAAAVAAGAIPAPPAPNASALLQLFYPARSVNPGQAPQGGADFYAAPAALAPGLARARNVSLEYAVFFPRDFDWVQAGKLPGIYGGHEGCSGGDPAGSCFSTRLMWRAGGAGELYLYAPKDKQTAALCRTPPQSVCDAAYGLSIGRGAFAFAAGNWTRVRQTVALNTPGVPDGGFALDVDGRRVIERADVFYRGAPDPAPAPEPASDPAPGPTDAPEPADADAPEQEMEQEQEQGQGPERRVTDWTVDLPSVAAFKDATDDNDVGEALADAPGQDIVYAEDAPAQESEAPAASPSAATPPDYFEIFFSPPANLSSPPAPASALPTGNATVPASLAPALPASVVTVTSTTTVPAPVQTVTAAAGTTATAYKLALETDAPLPLPSAVGFAAAAAEAEAAAAPAPIGFTGLFFSTFFGGHEQKYATPRDQFTWFKDFAMTINE